MLNVETRLVFRKNIKNDLYYNQLSATEMLVKHFSSLEMSGKLYMQLEEDHIKQPWNIIDRASTPTYNDSNFGVAWIVGGEAINV
ncbi:hypothetical protein Y032_0001g191 [Ancylostoma ceylanicum]|uniref:Uncharacterized protein n=1 Tax=Ancylostoma ceylanicum TaxID=53326 RepID=A0A016W2C6_9BILA|nr:hypothetical protein Y032_0001g191 [Ancylostoma ceylanicum]